jgi:hypothetical protein
MRASRRELVGSLVIGGAVFAATLRSGIARRHGTPATATPDEAHAFYWASAAKEPEERREAARHFRGSPWSQDDDFHHKEMDRVKDNAGGRALSVSSKLEALDEGMRSGWPTPDDQHPTPKVKPCRPRLTY